MAEDLAIDVPKIWLYLGQLIGAMIDARTASLQFLLSLCEPLRASSSQAAGNSDQTAGLVVGHALHMAARKMVCAFLFYCSFYFKNPTFLKERHTLSLVALPHS